MTDAFAGRREGMLLGAAALACALFAVGLLYPGQYAYDSANQLWQARTGNFGNGAPVAMIALWSALLDLTGNPTALFLLNLALFWMGLALCVATLVAPLFMRLALLAIVGLGPLALVQMAHVLTDAHLAATMMLASGLAALGSVRPSRATRVACTLVLVYAGCIRHNALLATAPFGFLIGRSPGDAKPPSAKAGWAGMAVLLALTLAVGTALDRGLVRARVTVWPVLALWDLAAISVDRNVLLLPPFTHGPGMTAAELTKTGAFDPNVNVPLFERSRSGMRDGYDKPYTPEEKRALLVAWFEAVRKYPGAYVRHRLRTFALMMGRHDHLQSSFAYVHGRIQFRDNPPLPDAVSPRAQAALYGIAARLAPGWIFAALPYVVIAVLAAAIGWMKRERAAGRLALVVSGSALLYTAGYAVLAPAIDLRYLTWPIVAAPLALAFALARERS